MFRSRSRGFYLYMFLRSCTEREREKELDNLAIKYIYSFIEYCFEREVLRYKKRHPAISLSLFRYDCNLLDWILDGCIRTREPYSIPLSLSLSKVWRMKTESRVWFVSFRAEWNWWNLHGDQPMGKRSSPYVRRSSCFFILARFYGP